MKTLTWMAAGLIAGVLALSAQQAQERPQPAPGDEAKAEIAAPPVGPQMGLGRGGAPFAWNDKDKDGICDITGQPIAQQMGLGRGGAPFAWGDRDKDGICDFTGRPVGQRLGLGRGGAWVRGPVRGPAGMWGRGSARGWQGRGGRWWGPGGFWQQQQQGAPATPQATPPAAEKAK